MLLENIKRIGDVTGSTRPDDSQVLPRERKPHTRLFKDDGVIPNHPKWPLVIYKSAVRLPGALDPAAVFEDLFRANGWGKSWRDSIYKYAHYHSRIHEVLGIARGSCTVQFGGTRGRAFNLKAGDVAILPAGTGHQCLKASRGFLAVGAYPRSGVYDECTSIEDRKRALLAIPSVARPRRILFTARMVRLCVFGASLNRRRPKKNGPALASCGARDDWLVTFAVCRPKDLSCRN